MDFLEYFDEHPCYKCADKSDNCMRRDGAWKGTTAMILNRLERIMIDGDCDCWEKRDYDNGF